MEPIASDSNEGRGDGRTLDACIVSFDVEKQGQLVAVSLPVPAPDGTISPKTPIFHLPVYKITLKFADGSEETSYCDLADLSDFMDSMRRLRKPMTSIKL